MGRWPLVEVRLYLDLKSLFNASLFDVMQRKRNNIRPMSPDPTFYSFDSGYDLLGGHDLLGDLGNCLPWGRPFEASLS